MYSKIKYLVKSLLPAKMIFRVEPFLRLVLYPFYIGRRYQCNICNSSLRKFVRQGDDLLCPVCGSLPRTRRLWELLNSEYLGDNKKVLDFSPSRSLYRKLKKYPGIHYFSTDRSGDFISDFQYDITSIDVETATFDIIICYHILEHVIDDRRAMQELFRVLKDDGICIIQAPFKEGEIYENWTVKTDDERLAHFGQRDHVRIYSVDGLRIRLSDAGFHVIIREFEAPERNKHGFSSHETVLLCTKSRL